MSRWVAIGKATRVHGLRGDLKVLPYGDTLERLPPGTEVFVKAAAGAPRPFVLARVVRRKRLLVVSLRAVTEAAGAAVLVGSEFALPEARMPATEPDEYYHFQLLGLRVRTVHGQELGTLSAIFEAGPHDIYTVATDDGREILLPAIASVILEVNLKDGQVLVDPPEGLIDDL